MRYQSPETPRTSGSERAEGPAIEIQGHLARITHRNERDGFTVLYIHDDNGESLKVVHHGPVPDLGTRVTCTGHWEQDRRGPQFRATALGRDTTHDLDYLADYLGKAGLPRLGAGRARRLVTALGSQAPWHLGHDPEHVSAVTGLSSGEAKRIQREWNDHLEYHRAQIALRYYGLNRSQAQAVIEKFDDHALERFRQDPYDVAHHVAGIGFLTADQAARRLGVGQGDTRRIQAGILEALERAAVNGDTAVGAGDLTTRAAELLGADEATVGYEINVLLESGKVERWKSAEGDAIQQPRFAYHERVTAEALTRRLGKRPPWADVTPAIEHSPVAAQLDRTQYNALERILASHTALLCGGPGTGKTTLLNCLIERLETCVPRGIILAAPTGCAAKRMSFSTGRPATTMHRALEYNPHMERFQRNARNPLDADLVVLDEASMISARDMRALIEAVPDDCALLLVGDPEQLPSVQPGEVLHDLVRSEALTTLHLEYNHRAGAGSDIPIAAAELLRDGQLPSAADVGGDVSWIDVDDDDRIADELERIVASEIPKHRPHLDPRRDIQVIAPMLKTSAGVRELNKRLQATLNPGPVSKHGYRAGDRVMHLVNKPADDLYNGDIGVIEHVDRGGAVTVEFDGGHHRLEPRSLGRITLAYACTIHKAQGSEAPCIVVPLARAHTYMIDRRILNTAMTRAKEQVICIGPRGRLRSHLHRIGVVHRRTTLCERLRAEIAGDAKNDCGATAAGQGGPAH